MDRVVLQSFAPRLDAALPDPCRLRQDPPDRTRGLTTKPPLSTQRGELQSGNRVELTLHIGLPKTATTTLQKHVFPQVAFYEGLFDSRTGSDLVWYSAYESWARQRTNWQATVRDFVRLMSDSERVLISNEGFSQWPIAPTSMFTRDTNYPLYDSWKALVRIRPHPITELLEAFRRSSASATKLRVIMSVRNQPEFLASWYAQIQDTMNRPGQSDFEGKVRQLIHDRDPFCDWHALVSELDEALGAENCLVLLHEDGMPVNVGKLSSFLDVKISSDYVDALRENVKRDGPQAWRGTPKSMPATRAGVLGWTRRTVARNWPQRWQTLGLRVHKFAAIVDSAAELTVPQVTRPGARIFLSDDLRADLREHFAPSNSRLSDRLGRDLVELGY
jgi:hypothetical protein